MKLSKEGRIATILAVVAILVAVLAWQFPRTPRVETNTTLDASIFPSNSLEKSDDEKDDNLSSPITEDSPTDNIWSYLYKVEPLLKDNGDAFYYEFSATDCKGDSFKNIVHPGSTGTEKTTGGMGAHAATGFNRTYKNNGYNLFTGTIFLSRDYALYTKHTLTLLFEVYGDGQLVYQAPYLITGLEQEAFPVEVDISGYEKVKIHFECVNDTNMFSWEDCVFGIADAIFQH